MYEEFLNKLVDVKEKGDRPFFHRGILKEASNEGILLLDDRRGLMFLASSDIAAIWCVKQ